MEENSSKLWGIYLGDQREVDPIYSTLPLYTPLWEFWVKSNRAPREGSGDGDPCLICQVCSGSPPHSASTVSCLSPSGPPDVEQPCEPSLQAWSPELSLYDTNVTSPCPETDGCTLTLKFLHAVVPQTLTLWVTYVSTSKSHGALNTERRTICVGE